MEVATAPINGLSNASRMHRYLSLFSRSTDVIPLNNAAVCPLNLNAAVEMVRALTEATKPNASIRDVWVNEYRGAHEIFAELLDCDPNEVTFMPNVASAMSSIADALNLKSDDEIVTIDQEYGSNAYPWYEAAARSGARVVTAASGPDFSLETATICRLIGPKTRAVAVSWVQFQTGAAIDLKQLSKACRDSGALLVVDTTQGVGIAPFSMRLSGADIVVGSMHKWLGGPVGLSYLAVKESRLNQLRPTSVGPYSYGDVASGYDSEAKLLTSALRFRSGTPALLQILGAAAAARANLDAGVQQISERALSLAVTLRGGLVAQGHTVLSPATMTSPIVTFVPYQGIVAASKELVAKGVLFALRGGGVRLSPHAFNTDSDVDLALRALAGDGRPSNL